MWDAWLTGAQASSDFLTRSQNQLKWRQTRMKVTRIAMLSLAVVLYATAALAQHGHSGGAAGGNTGMGAAMGHGTGLDHASSGKANAGSSGSTSKAAVNDILKK